MKLATTDTDFRDLERTVDGTRGGMVRVPKLALQHLLADHLDMVAQLARTIEVGPDQQSLRGLR